MCTNIKRPHPHWYVALPACSCPSCLRCPPPDCSYCRPSPLVLSPVAAIIKRMVNLFPWCADVHVPSQLQAPARHPRHWRLQLESAVGLKAHSKIRAVRFLGLPTLVEGPPLAHRCHSLPRDLSAQLRIFAEGNFNPRHRDTAGSDRRLPGNRRMP